jgi:hypothetical protein
MKARSDQRDAIESLCRPPRQWWDVMPKAPNLWLGENAECTNWRQVEAALRRDEASLNTLLDAQINLTESLLQLWFASASRVLEKPQVTAMFERSA